MPDRSVDPKKVADEAGRWFEFARRMSEIRQATAGLYLGPGAFFPGGLGTEPGHFNKYRNFLDEVVHRLQGGAIEFELIGITLRRIAASYEEEELVTAQSFRAVEEEVDRATEAHTPAAPPAHGPQPFN